MRGSWLLFALAASLGTFTFAGIAILVAARPRTTEVAAMVMNLPMLPQMVLSGVFFSAARFPDWLQPFVQALPLTALNDAMRAIANEGAGPAEVALELAILAAWALAAMLVGLRLFRWS
jgi:ABC-type multidrug transport system permease subunit